MKSMTAIARLAIVAASLALGACSLLGGAGERERAAIFSPDPRVAADPAWPRVDWQLSINPPSAARTVDTFRIAVRPSPGELQVYSGASWARSPTDMVEEVVLRTLEDSGHIAGVSRRGSGVAPDYRLLLDLRRFEADYAGSATPAATIELHAKLLHARSQGIVASRTFTVAEPATGTDVTTVAATFTSALETLGRDVAGWTLTTGAAHSRTAPAAASTASRR